MPHHHRLSDLRARRAARANLAGCVGTPPSLQLAVGLLFTLLGAILTLDAIDLMDASRALRLWPLAVVGAGAIGLSRARGDDARVRAWIWMAVGGLLLVTSMGWSRAGFWDLFWPIVLVVVGVKLGLRALRPAPTPAPSADTTASPGADARPSAWSNGSHLIALLGESKRTVQDRPFLGASMTAVLGSCVLDLRQAEIPRGHSAAIDLAAVLAGHEIIVPAGWIVESRVTPIAGSVEDGRSPAYRPAPGPDADGAPRLILRGFVLFSGLTIRD